MKIRLANRKTYTFIFTCDGIFFIKNLKFKIIKLLENKKNNCKILLKIKQQTNNKKKKIMTIQLNIFKINHKILVIK